MTSNQWQEILYRLESNGWLWRDDILYAPNGSMWLPREPWDLDIAAFLQWMEGRAARIRRNRDASQGDERAAADEALTDVLLLVDAATQVAGRVAEKRARRAGPWRVDVAVVAASHGRCQDRAGCFELDGAHVLVVADGAGGTVGGTAAAEAVHEAVRLAATHTQRQDWCAVLAEIDAELCGAGQTTAVVVEVRGNALAGASAGDSSCWVFGRTATELTAGQRRKPLIGAGAVATPFTATLSAGDVLVLGSDGLFKYAPLRDIETAALAGASAAELAELARLPSGGLQDDVAVVLLR